MELVMAGMVCSHLLLERQPIMLAVVEELNEQLAPELVVWVVEEPAHKV
jgi:hypothetical protein